MVRITFLQEKISIEVPEGCTILEAMREAGLHPDAPCGGRGKCGKCMVTLTGGEKVLACRTIVQDGMQVEKTSDDTMDTAILTQAMGDGVRKSTLRPAVRVQKVHMRPCPAGESISDWTRFKEGLDQSLGKETDCRKDNIPKIASVLGPMSRKTGGDLYAVLFGEDVLDVCEEPPRVCMAAFDIGTTTVAAYLLDAADGAVLSVQSCMNPQAEFGADVVNRANYSLEHGMEELSARIREALQQLLVKMAEEAGVSLNEIYAVSVVGNTCMHHFFLGICVDSLVHAPYNPAVSEPLVLRTADYGLKVHPAAPLLMVPNIAGFVGADTVGCLTATQLAEQEEWTLLIDIGTNGEMVLGRSHQMIACSTAAGPAFEGAGISCGMRGSAGAISKVSWAGDHWEYETVENEPPKGICGSGLLDLAAELLRSGQMDETGQLQEDTVITLAEAQESAGEGPVTILQKDIRQLQLAKAAIAAGIRLLAEETGIRLKEIKKVWLAGAFGSFLSPDNACAIGLIPEELKGRIFAVGNAAGEGAKLVLLDENMWKYAQKCAAETRFLELASLPEFQDCFVDELLFPE